MASVVIAIGIAVYYSTEKIRERKEKKRALKAQEALDRGLVEELSAVDDTTGHLINNEDLPAYHKENLPPYRMQDQHRAFQTDKRHHQFHL
jgi:hypothetical protein